MIQITVPIDPRLHAHAKGHWRIKAKATSEARESAYLLSMGYPKITGVTVLEICFRVPDLRRRDILNLCQSLKPSIDGVVDAEKIIGDHWEVLRIGKIEVVVAKELKTVEAVLTFREFQ